MKTSQRQKSTNTTVDGLKMNLRAARHRSPASSNRSFTTFASKLPALWSREPPGMSRSRSTSLRRPVARSSQSSHCASAGRTPIPGGLPPKARPCWRNCLNSPARTLTGAPRQNSGCRGYSLFFGVPSCGVLLSGDRRRILRNNTRHSRKAEHAILAVGILELRAHSLRHIRPERSGRFEGEALTKDFPCF
jgi:hypothetical protein